MKHCCVIGGAGFIGKHLVDELLKCKRKVTVIGRRLPSEINLPKSVSYLSGDYGSEEFLINSLRDVDEVIHLAYSSVPKTSYDNPIEDILSNLPATATLLKVASTLSLDKIIFVSSGGTVYGKSDDLPINENHITNPISPYGITKLAIEKYMLMYSQLESLPVICVRPSNAYGQGQQPFRDQGFIATAIASIIENKEITVYGAEGTIRDYIHVYDVVTGIISVLGKGKIGTCYNIGSSVGRSNKDVLDEIFIHAIKAGYKKNIENIPSRKFDVPANILDSSRLSQDTGWNMLIDFKTGIEKTWDWYLKNKA